MRMTRHIAPSPGDPPSPTAENAVGGDDGLVARDDAYSVRRSDRVDVLANDRLNGDVVRAGTGGNVVMSLVEPPSGAHLTFDADALDINDLPPGTWARIHRLCDAADATRCTTATVRLKIALGELVAVADEVTLWIDGPPANVLLNDRETAPYGRRIEPGQFTTVEAATALPAGIELSPSGGLAAGGAAVPGTWTIGDRVCDSATLSNCSSAQINRAFTKRSLLNRSCSNAIPAVTVPGLRPRTVTTPVPFEAPGGSLGHWLLAEIDVDGTCVVRMHERLEMVDTLPTPATRPARRCGS